MLHVSTRLLQKLDDDDDEITLQLPVSNLSSIILIQVGQKNVQLMLGVAKAQLITTVE